MAGLEAPWELTGEGKERRDHGGRGGVLSAVLLRAAVS